MSNNTNPAVRRKMSIRGLNPLQGSGTNEFVGTSSSSGHSDSHGDLLEQEGNVFGSKINSSGPSHENSGSNLQHGSGSGSHHHHRTGSGTTTGSSSSSAAVSLSSSANASLSNAAGSGNGPLLRVPTRAVLSKEKQQLHNHHQGSRIFPSSLAAAAAATGNGGGGSAGGVLDYLGESVLLAMEEERKLLLSTSSQSDQKQKRKSHSTSSPSTTPQARQLSSAEGDRKLKRSPSKVSFKKKKMKKDESDLFSESSSSLSRNNKKHHNNQSTKSLKGERSDVSFSSAEKDNNNNNNTEKEPPNRKARRKFSTSQDQQYRNTDVLGTLSVGELDKMKKLFDAHDEDKSGSIDEHELMPLLEELGHPMQKDQALDLVAQVDINGNGELEFSEFLQLVLIFKNVAQFRLYEDSSQLEHGEKSGNSAEDKQAGGGGGGKRGGGRRRGSFIGGEQDDDDSCCSHESFFASCLPDCLLNLFPLHHESGWLWAWEIILLVTCVYVWCSTTSIYAFGDTDESAANMQERFDVTDIVFTVIIAFEMIRQCVTRVRYFDKKTGKFSLLVTLKEISTNYITSGPWFLFDLLSLVPLRLAAGPDIAGLVLAHFRLLFLWHLGVIMARRSFADIDRWFVYFFLTFAPIATGLVFFFALVHLMAIVAFRLSLCNSYVQAIYVVLYCFSGAGFGDVEPQTNSQRSFLAFLCLLSMIVNGFVIGSIVSFFGSSDVDSVRKSRLVQTLAVLDFFQVPIPLQEEILQFQNHLMVKNIQAAFSSVVDSLPTEMKVGLGLQIRIQLVRSIELFRMAHPSTQIALAQELFTIVLCPEEFVTLAEEEGEDMFFISYGFVDMLTAGGVYIQTLKTYESFGAEVVFGPVEEAIREHKRQGRDDDEPLDITKWGTYNCSVKSLTYVELLGLNVPTFDVILRQFPRFRQTVEQQLLKPGVMSKMFGITGDTTNENNSNNNNSGEEGGGGNGNSVGVSASDAANAAAGGGGVGVGGDNDETVRIQVASQDGDDEQKQGSPGITLSSASGGGNLSESSFGESTELGKSDETILRKQSTALFSSNAQLAGQKTEESGAGASSSNLLVTKTRLVERRHTRTHDIRANAQVLEKLRELNVADNVLNDRRSSLGGSSAATRDFPADEEEEEEKYEATEEDSDDDDDDDHHHRHHRKKKRKSRKNKNKKKQHGIPSSTSEPLNLSQDQKAQWKSELDKMEMFLKNLQQQKQQEQEQQHQQDEDDEVEGEKRRSRRGTQARETFQLQVVQEEEDQTNRQILVHPLPSPASTTQIVQQPNTPVQNLSFGSSTTQQQQQQQQQQQNQQKQLPVVSSLATTTLLSSRPVTADDMKNNSTTNLSVIELAAGTLDQQQSSRASSRLTVETEIHDGNTSNRNNSSLSTNSSSNNNTTNQPPSRNNSEENMNNNSITSNNEQQEQQQQQQQNVQVQEEVDHQQFTPRHQEQQQQQQQQEEEDGTSTTAFNWISDEAAIANASMLSPHDEPDVEAIVEVDLDGLEEEEEERLRQHEQEFQYKQQQQRQ